ncbi:MAG: hypothetical protein HPY85_09795 [Anaerolineae bacterium]|nr:hypothetical protein [Anaerolineae bacterium]
MENVDIPVTDVTEAEHAYRASGHTNGKITWVVLVNLLADIVVAILAPVIYMLIITLVLAMGFNFCNVCGILIIVLPIALAVPWVFGYGVGELVNIINVGMQKATHNNHQGLRWFFMVFTIIGMIVVFAFMWFNGTALEDIDVGGWVVVVVVIYGAIGMSISMLAVGQTEPLPPFCEPCLEYMEKLKLPEMPVNDVHRVMQALQDRQFLMVLQNQAELDNGAVVAVEGEPGQPQTPVVTQGQMKKGLSLLYYYCKGCAGTGVLEATYQTETVKMERNKEKKENASRRIFSTLLTPEEVQVLTPLAQGLATNAKKK